MHRPMKRIMRMKRARDKRIAAEMEAIELRLRPNTTMSPEEMAKLLRKRQARLYGRPSHYDKPESYYQRRNTPKNQRAAV